MGFLDSISNFFGGGSSSPTIQTQTTQTSPWGPQQEHLTNIFSGAKAAYDSSAPSYFPDSTVVGFSPQTEQALGGIEQRALTGSPVQQAAMQQAQKTLQGDYVGAQNPFLSGAYQAATQPMIDQFLAEIAPGVDSSFSGAGRMGSGLYAKARNRAEDTLAGALADTAAKMGYQDYSKERQYQQQMVGAAPGLAQSDYADYGRLMGVGGAREGLEQARLQDQINRFNFEQERPWEQLARYSGLVSGGYGSTGTTSTPLYSNPGANFLGGALGGAQIGNMIGGQSGAGWGAGLGGLIGMLG